MLREEETAEDELDEEALLTQNAAVSKTHFFCFGARGKERGLSAGWKWRARNYTRNYLIFLRRFFFPALCTIWLGVWLVRTLEVQQEPGAFTACIL